MVDGIIYNMLFIIVTLHYQILAAASKIYIKPIYEQKSIHHFLYVLFFSL